MDISEILAALKNLSWTERGAIVGTISGLAGLYFNWRTRAELKASKRPILTMQHSPGEIWPNSFIVKLRSRSNVGWTAAKIRVVWPREALISKTPDEGSSEKSRAINPVLRVANEGRKGPDGYMGKSDEHQVSLLLFLPSKGKPRTLPFSTRAWMLVTLVDETGTTRWRVRCPKFTFKDRN